MSRIGRLPVAIPAGVTVEVAANNVVTVTGPKGTLVKELPVEMEIKVEGEEVVVTRPSDLKKLTVKRCGYFRLRILQGWESADMKEAVCIRSSLNRMKFVR